MSRTAAPLLLLATLTMAAPFAPGTRFGTVGLDSRFSSGKLYAPYLRYRTEYVQVDPSFRVGVAVIPDLAVGAEVALFNTFPESSDMFTNTPVFAFGPSATYFLPPNAQDVRPYVTASAGANYGFTGHGPGWRIRLGTGAILVTRSNLAFGVEAGWYSDWYRSVRRYRGDTGFLGLRVMGFK